MLKEVLRRMDTSSHRTSMELQELSLKQETMSHRIGTELQASRQELQSFIQEQQAVNSSSCMQAYVTP